MRVRTINRLHDAVKCAWPVIRSASERHNQSRKHDHPLKNQNSTPQPREIHQHPPSPGSLLQIPNLVRRIPLLPGIASIALPTSRSLPSSTRRQMTSSAARAECRAIASRQSIPTDQTTTPHPPPPSRNHLSSPPQNPRPRKKPPHNHPSTAPHPPNKSSRRSPGPTLVARQPRSPRPR